MKAVSYEGVYKALFKWFASTRANKIPICGAVLQRKVMCLLGRGVFQSSTGWLHRFKARRLIIHKSLIKESSLAETRESAAGNPQSLRPDRLPQCGRDGTVLSDASRSHAATEKRLLNSLQLEISCAHDKNGMTRNVFHICLQAFKEDMKDAGHHARSTLDNLKPADV